MEGREMQVISRLRTHVREQRTIDPVHDRSVHFTRTAKHPAIILEIRYEDVLYLQVSAGMKQWNGIQKAFHCTGTEMESLIHNSFADELLE